MIFIAAKMKVTPEWADRFLPLVEDFTNATRGEPGNLWFEWSRSVDDPNEFVLIEAFRDGHAGAAHVGSEHFQAAIATMPQALAETPRIINFEVPGDDWSRMGEMKVD